MTDKEVQNLLDRLCIDLGFCLPSEKQREIMNNTPTSVDDFVVSVFEAEGLTPDHVDRRIYRQVREVVESAFHGESRV